MSDYKDFKLLAGMIVGSVVTYNIARSLRSLWQQKAHPSDSELVPIGTVKNLYIYPVKSCKAKKVFSIYCGPVGGVAGENRDRNFLIIDGKSGRCYTARQVSCLVLLECDVTDGILTLSTPKGSRITVSLATVLAKNDERQAVIFNNERQDGLDCGDEVAAFLAEFMNEPDVRLIMHKDGLYTERTVTTKESFWNNPVPHRKDDFAFNDFSPYMILSEASLDELNKKLDHKVTMERFRPVIVVEHCPAWDEDKWAEVQFGDTQLQCYCPCTRCVMTTIDPFTAERADDYQPLNTLKEFRLAPEGPMRNEFKDSPMFGVYAGVQKPGYIHIGQTVYARYKKSAF